MGLEVPRLVQRLREHFASPTSTTQAKTKSIVEPEANSQSLDSPPPGPENVPSGESSLTRRTGWTLRWDVRRSVIEVDEGGGETWTEKVPEIPPNVQEIIAGGGLVKTRQKMFAAQA